MDTFTVMPSTSEKISASFRLSDEATTILNKLAEHHGIAMVPLLEMLARKWHRDEELDGTLPVGFLQFMHRRGRKSPFSRRLTQEALLYIKQAGHLKGLSDADALEYMAWREARHAGLLG